MKDELLEKIYSLVVLPESSESDADHLMTLIRKIQERDNKTQKYPLLIFYCDWTKHAILNRKVAQKIVLELNSVLFKIKDIADNDIVISEISQIISFERLQSEFHSFLFDYNLPLDIVIQKKLWLRFVVHLINITSNSVLELPREYKKNVPESINGIIATSLKFTWVKRNLFIIKNSSTEEILTLIITLSNTSTLVLPCKVLGLYLTKKDSDSLLK